MEKNNNSNAGATGINNTRKQRAAEQTCVNLINYIINHPGATCRTIAEDMGMSFPNVCRLAADFLNRRILMGSELIQTGQRGPWAQTLIVNPELGCSIGVDLEATHIRGVVLDISNNIRAVKRVPIFLNASSEDIVTKVADLIRSLVDEAHNLKLKIHSAGLGFPGSFVDMEKGRIRAEMQCGDIEMEFGEALKKACDMKPSYVPSKYCTAIAHHRIHNPRSLTADIILMNRFGISASLVWNGQLYTGSSYFVGELGLIPIDRTGRVRRYSDVCSGASLMKLARSKGDSRSFQELLQYPEDATVKEWLKEAIPAFAWLIYLSVLTYNPARIIIEGIFNRLNIEIQRNIKEAARDLISKTINRLPSIEFYGGDDLMGARGAALWSRDELADEIIRPIVKYQ